MPASVLVRNTNHRVEGEKSKFIIFVHYEKRSKKEDDFLCVSVVAVQEVRRTRW